MRDEMDARIWVDSHERFSRDMDALLHRLFSLLKRVPRAARRPGIERA